MPAKAPIYLKPTNSKKGKKCRLRDILSPDMISPPLGDFRHTIHIGRGGEKDVFGDMSFLQGKFELLPGKGDIHRQFGIQSEFLPVNTPGDAFFPETPSPVLKNAISLPTIGGCQALTLPPISSGLPPEPLEDIMGPPKVENPEDVEILQVDALLRSLDVFGSEPSSPFTDIPSKPDVLLDLLENTDKAIAKANKLNGFDKAPSFFINAHSNSICYSNGGTNDEIPYSNGGTNDGIHYSNRGTNDEIPYSSRGTNDSIHYSNGGINDGIHYSNKGTNNEIPYSNGGTHDGVHYSNGGTNNNIPYFNGETNDGIHYSNGGTNDGIHYSNGGTNDGIHYSNGGTNDGIHYSIGDTNDDIPYSNGSTNDGIHYSNRGTNDGICYSNGGTNSSYYGDFQSKICNSSRGFNGNCNENGNCNGYGHFRNDIFLGYKQELSKCNKGWVDRDSGVEEFELELSKEKSSSEDSLTQITGSLLSLELDLGPSILDDVLNIMDKTAAKSRP
ncbi:cdc42 effector protein 3 [Austrofundulus limnaeus]|uniref:Cdc42 effector protein 3 n=1 Tax=Austrofundulus limnaeus TaxID=52670 RepID=A0A2I4C5Q0_AUSLI|nr:PREDICTED: uncharacterized protein LOC106525588 [Austrofundulus limnaeus]